MEVGSDGAGNRLRHTVIDEAQERGAGITEQRGLKATNRATICFVSNVPDWAAAMYGVLGIHPMAGGERQRVKRPKMRCLSMEVVDSTRTFH